MKTIDRHAISLAHNEGGVLVALLLTPDSIGVAAQELTSPLWYRYSAGERSITFHTHDDSPEFRLCDVDDQVIAGCGKGLPLVFLDDTGKFVLQAVGPASGREPTIHG